MVNDLITCYEVFKTNQPKLHELVETTNRKVLAELLKTNYVQNKQAYEELEYYKINSALLGKHPIYKLLELKESISQLTTPKLFNKIKALETNIFRNEQKGNTELVERDKALLEHAKQVAENR